MLHVCSARETVKSQDETGLEHLPQWQLDDLYSGRDSATLASDLAWAEERSLAFQKKYAGKLGKLLSGAGASQTFYEAVAAFEQIEDRLGRVMAFAFLQYATKTSDPVRAKFYGDMQDRLTELSSRLLFFPLELNRLDEALLAKAAGTKPLLHYKPWLEDLAQERPFQLDENIERLFHEKSVTGHSAWNRLFDETLSMLKFDVDGDKLGLEQTLHLMTDEEGKVRETAARALALVFKDNLRLFTQITNTLAKDKEISDRWRGFEDVAQSRHLANRVEPEVVDALARAVKAAYPRLSHRYYRLKAKFMGQDRLAHWDRNAPLPFADTRIIPWDEAKSMVMDAYYGFAPEMADIAARFFENNWIDAAMRLGKAPGAFAHPTVPSVHPYVLLNYQGRTRDVMTLAHELGHGVHQVLAAPQGALMAPTPLTLAETASVFGEMVTFRALLEQAKTRDERRALLAGKIEDMLNTVVRQIAFYLFEREVHLARRKGELTSDQIGELWMMVQSESLGPAIELKPGYENFWAYVPHFIHAPFYVYAYAFGDCLVNSLYGVYEKAQTGFSDRYFELLKAGGSRPYHELLEPFGLDAKDPEFWSIGLDMISGLIDQLEAEDA
jgi:oligoendopeptidase F